MTARFRVAITDFIDDDLAPELRILGDIADVMALNAYTESDLVGKIESVDAIMIYHNLRISSATISTLTNCKLIVRCGVGFDNVDHILARSKGIPVANVPDYGTEEVADSAIGLMLSLTRGIHLLNQRLQHGDGAWTYLHAAPIVRLRGRVFAIVGLGRIDTFNFADEIAFGVRIERHDIGNIA